MHKKSIGKTYNVITFFLLFFFEKFLYQGEEIKTPCKIQGVSLAKNISRSKRQKDVLSSVSTLSFITL